VDGYGRARFSREAQVLAVLNHPNIAHIHGFEDSTGLSALVMERVHEPGTGARADRRQWFSVQTTRPYDVSRDGKRFLMI